MRITQFNLLPINGHNRFLRGLARCVFSREYFINVIHIAQMDKIEPRVAIRVWNDHLHTNILEFGAVPHKIIFLGCHNKQGIIV